MQHFLAAEALIIARLRAAIPALAYVGGWRDIDSVLDGTYGEFPAALVVYDGDTGADAKGNTALTTQRWVVVLVDNAPQSQGDGEAARASLGPLISATIADLNGAQLTEYWRKLKFAGGVVPRYLKGGIAAMGVPFYLERAV